MVEKTFRPSALLLLGACVVPVLSACDCGGGGIAQVRPVVRADPNPLPFPEAFVGFRAARDLVISNRGSAPLAVSSLTVKEGSDPGLSITNAAFELAPAGESVVQVHLTASTIGPVTGAILIASNDPETPVLEVPIVATGARRPGPAIAVCVESAAIPLAKTCSEAPRIDFGSVPTGSTVEATISIESAGDLPLVVGPAAPAAGAHPSFSFDPATVSETLAPSATRTVTVRFTPTTEDAVAAVFQVLSNDLAREIIPVSISGNGIAAAICVDPTSVDFGTVTIGMSAERTVTLTSCGRAPVSLEGLAIAGAAAEFSILDPLTSTVALQPGERREVHLRYTPADAGFDRDQLRVSSSSGEVFVPLSGRAPSCDLSATPMALSFGGVASGRSRSLNVLLENSGEADCVVSGLTINGSNEFRLPSPPATPATIPAGQSTTVAVEYAPQDAGADMGTLAIASNDPAEPRIDVALDGRRLEPGECQLTANPAAVAFGGVPFNTNRTMTVQITNTGQSLCTVIDVRLTPSSSRDFSLIRQVMLPLLAAGRSMSVEVRFSPLVAGPQTGTLEVVTRINGMASIAVPLSGAGAGPKLCPDPNPVVFGTHPLGGAVTRQLSLISCGSDAVDVSRLELVSPTSPEITIPTPPATPLQIPAGGMRVVDLTYRGVDAGRDDGILRVTSNDPIAPTQDVRLIAATGSDCGDVQGKICGLGARGPVAGATVYVDTPGGRVMTTTDPNGDYVLTCLPTGTHNVHAEIGSWDTTFPASVAPGQVTSLSGQNCLDPRSAQIAVVWGEWDQMESILGFLNVPYTYYDEMDASQLLLDPTELMRYDIVFLNCGFAEGLVTSGQGLGYLQAYVQGGGSLYASDWAYDAIEQAFPPFVDFLGNDTVIDAAQSAGNFSDLVDVVEPTLRAALGGRQKVAIESCCSGIDSAGPTTTVYLEGDRFKDGGRHPLFVGFQPTPTSGTVMYTDFHNTGQADIVDIFAWLLTRL